MQHQGGTSNMQAVIDDTEQLAARASRRRLTQTFTGLPNTHKYWWSVRRSRDGVVGPLRIIVNYLLITVLRHAPSLLLKRLLLRALGMKLASDVTIASGAMLDYFFPELIEIGQNSIVGMDVLILTHEFLHDRWRVGPVQIGRDVLIGARSTILAGVSIGDGATISAMSLVNRDVAPGAFVGGNPIVELRRPSIQSAVSP
jgi:serine acetyltransferase